MGQYLRDVGSSVTLSIELIEYVTFYFMQLTAGNDPPASVSDSLLH